MKRTIKIRADSGGVKLAVTAQITTSGTLTRDEVAALCHDLASRLMLALPGLRYTGLTLAQVETVK